MSEQKTYLPLGSIVITEGSLKKLMIVSRATILGNEYYDYQAVLYPEGMIDENVACFNREDIIKIVHEGFTDDDDELLIAEINAAYARFEAGEKLIEEVENTETVSEEDDPFAAVRDLEDW
ncbi:DUF4176 domain-containing protein [Listeria innocua]|uniref:DUF4176 domain-containing protein n=1 Tax=Listeria innocua TaxID=1642 RepID=UPI0016286307|nr:DUF4176 domain-containing protein [Listeria innocua]MBC1925540.1 DUF4176 domain-containing protein [Listeria innocua]